MKKNKLLKSGILISALAAALPLTANAETEKSKATGSGPNPFSDCGIGAALFQETKWAAVTSNVIWDIGTTAVTSATASPETCNGKRVETAQFIIDNYDNLVEETARGNGDHLHAMLQVRGCDASAHGAIMSEVRRDMSGVISQPDYTSQPLTDKASGFFEAVDSVISERFTSSCPA